MQELEIKDVQSGAVYRIAAQGSVIGREGAKADIIIKNPSVSKRHARIYATDGQWFLEDLGSSNGTFFANQRISEPVPLGPGTLFALAEIQFEVVKKPGSNGEDRGARDRMRAATAARPDDGELLGGGGGATARPSMDAGGDEEMATGVGAIMSVLPRAFAHYLVAVPKLAFNPVGTVRASIEDMQHPAMSWWSLAGWGIPPMLLVAVVAVLVSVISMLVAGAFNVGVLIGVIITPAIMVAVAIVMALIWHPVVGFVIKLFKGHSDARSRSNYFVMSMTAQTLGQLVSAVGALFLLIPVPFIGVAPVLLGVVASVISMVVAYFWVKYFEVHKIVQILVLVGLVLTALSGLWGVYGVVAGGTAATMAAANGAAANAAAAEAAAAAARAAAEAGAAAGAAGAEAAAAGAEANKLADEKVKAALEAAAKAGAAGKVSEEAARALAEAAAENAGKGEKMKAEVEKMAAEEARAREEAEKAKAAEKASAAEKAAAEKAAATEKAAAEKAAAAAEKAAAAAEKAGAEAAPRGGSNGSYPAWAAKRDAIEKAIADDPTLLNRAEVLRLYEAYQRVAFDVRKNYNAKRNKNEPWRDKIIERQISAETFVKSKSTIEELHDKLF